MRPRQPHASHASPMSVPGSNEGPEMTGMRRLGADDRVPRHGVGGKAGIQDISRRRDLRVRNFEPRLGIQNTGVADKVWRAPEQRPRPATSRSIVLGPCMHGGIGSKTGRGLWMTCNIAYAAAAARSRPPSPGPRPVLRPVLGPVLRPVLGPVLRSVLAPIPRDEAKTCKAWTMPSPGS
jgi:hypothetical protein